MLQNKLETLAASYNDHDGAAHDSTKELRNLMFNIIEEKIEKRLRTRKLLEESAGLASDI